jgi:hypothetical protein
MTAARAVVAALLLVPLASGTAHAQVGPRRLVVYPLVAGRSAAASDMADAASLVEPALRRVAQRSEEVVLADPLFARGACGPGATAALPCLAGLAEGGLLLRVTVQRAQTLLVVQLEAVDARARGYGPVTVSVDAYAQSAEPIVRGVLILVDQVVTSGRKPDLRAGVPLPPPPPSTTPAARAPAPLAAAERPAPAAAPGAWMRTAGPWLTGIGAAALAGGLALSVANRSLSNELDRKYQAGTLTPSDLDAYRRVRRNDTATQVLFAAGGTLTLSGVAIWTAAPSRGAAAGVAGRF